MIIVLSNMCHECIEKVSRCVVPAAIKAHQCEFLNELTMSQCGIGGGECSIVKFLEDSDDTSSVVTLFGDANAIRGACVLLDDIEHAEMCMLEICVGLKVTFRIRCWVSW